MLNKQISKENRSNNAKSGSVNVGPRPYSSYEDIKGLPP